VSLAEKRESLLEDLKDQLAVIAAGHAVKDTGEVFEQAARDFQAIACCNLLLNADRAGFQKHLIWSGFAQRTFLSRSRQQGNGGDFRLARSRWESLYCAIAAADEALAGEIHFLAPPDWVRDGEYEDDFAYHLFVSLLAIGADATARAGAVARLEKALGDKESARLDLCRAIQGGDGKLFEDALGRRIEERASEVKEDKEVTSEDDVAFEPLANLFVEGLALVRLGAGLGLAPPRDYPMCPSLAWLQPPASRPDDLFAEIEQQMGRKP
jgi:hypothetical protein